MPERKRLAQKVSVAYDQFDSDLISLIPAGHSLSPASRILGRRNTGKIGGRIDPATKLASGYNWLHKDLTREALTEQVLLGAGVGLRSARWPAIDSDIEDADFSAALARALVPIVRRERLLRRGRPNSARVLIPFRTALDHVPSRRLEVRSKANSDAIGGIDLLGEGRQYAVDALHHSGVRYEWDNGETRGGIELLTPSELPVWDAGTETAALEALRDVALARGWEIAEGKASRSNSNRNVSQEWLRAPTIEALREAVSVIPNTNEAFSSRDDYIRMLAAIRAAAGPEHEAEGLEIALEWALRWEGNHNGPNDANGVISDWRRL
jgi:hypothetical protein